MPAIDLKLNGDGCWPDVREKIDTGQAVVLMGRDAPMIGLAPLRGGMESGKHSVTIRIPLPDGRTLLTETSLDLLNSAVRAMNAALDAS